MITITLPDGSRQTHAQPPSGADIAAQIGPGLAKAALALVVDENLWDLTRPIPNDASVRIITRKDEEALDLIRHDCAHIMAEAVQALFPKTQITFGPTTDNGMYYDFVRDEPFSLSDFEAIEAKMHELIKADTPLVREVWQREDAREYFTSIGEIYKAEHVGELPDGEPITIYRQGEWLDLCLGPHLPSTGHVGKGFKLMKLSGAYWRGDATRAQLQRVYAACWRDEKELRLYLTQLEEAERRDHRKLGKQLQWFHLQQEAPGGVFWHEQGWKIYQQVEDYMRRRLDEGGYGEVKTPQLVDRSLWERSGHWEKFRDNMFVAEVDETLDPDAQENDTSAPQNDAQDDDAQDDDPMRRIMALKPMNCPCHVQIFRQGITSYRDLPWRMSEFGSCHRYEPSGALHGLMRVRAFTQDDGHIFCTEEQIVSESQIFCDLLRSVYADFGFKEIYVKFSDRPPVRAGDDAIWDKSEAALRTATEQSGLEYVMNPGEGAFYGPKLEFVLRDAIGRDWQCGTLQVDFVLPERLDAQYTTAEGTKERPVMLHRAILGSFERFLGILIEEHAARMPIWLAPTQAVICTITSAINDYANDIARQLQDANLRAKVDLRNEKINYKIREHSHNFVPQIWVVGEREAEQGQIAIRELGGKTQQIMSLEDAISQLRSQSQPPDLARLAS